MMWSVLIFVCKCLRIIKSLYSGDNLYYIVIYFSLVVLVYEIKL